MTLAFAFLAIVQSFATSLGVGSSTLAIINFFNAIADGTIDSTERRMMGAVYIVLRVAMVAILVAVTATLALEWVSEGFVLSAAHAAELLVVGMLYLNAGLMTLKIMPSTVGPGLQAGSWYTLGALQALAMQGIIITAPFMVTFILAYTTWIVLAVGIVNAIMEILKQVKK